MPTYRYKAIVPSGQIKAGSIEAVDTLSALSELQAKGFMPIEAALAGPNNRPAWLKLPAFAGRISKGQVGSALQELSVLLQAGLPLDRALDLLASETGSKRLQPVLADVLNRVRRGGSLSDAVAAHSQVFSSSVVTLIEAGEAGGTLETSLLRAADMLIKGAALRETITSALIYPLILLVVSGVSLTIILTVVLPEFKPLFEDAGASLPLPTRIVMAIGDAVGAYWFPSLVVLVAAIIAGNRLIQRPAVRLSVDGRLLKLPILGAVIGKIETARLARTLGTLIENGIPLPAALGISYRGLNNTVLAQAVERVGTSLKEGEGLAGPLEATGLFPRTSLHLIRVGEETARLGEMLDRLADILEREVQRTVQRALTLMVPLITVGLGIVIAGIIASILVAILSLNDLAL